jgi:hypothetical protein
MTDLTRRNFFRIAAGAAIAPVMAKVALATDPPPILWGDGIHHDDEALQALIDGRVVEFGPLCGAEGAGWNGSMLILPSGEFRLGKGGVTVGPDTTIIIGNGAGLGVVRKPRTTFIFEHAGMSAIIARNGKDPAAIRNLLFVTEPEPHGPFYDVRRI